MPNPRSGKKAINWKTLGIIGLIGGAAALFFWGTSYIPGTPWSVVNIPGQTPTTAFVVTMTDGKTADDLSLDDFDYTLYGADDLSEWLDYEVIESGSGLGKIVASDLDAADYAYWVVKYNGTVEEDFFNDTLGERTYAVRWGQLLQNTNNQLMAYQKPSSVGVVALNSETLAYLNISGSALTGVVNCTWIIGSNASQLDASWTYGWNYQTNSWDKPRLVVTYNATVTSDIAMSIKGTTRVRVTGTIYSYELSEITASALVLDGIWGDSATKFYKVSTAALYYGDTAL